MVQIKADPALMCELADQLRAGNSINQPNLIVLYQGGGTLQGKTDDVCSSEEIKLYGVSRPLYTEITAEAVKKEMWPKNRTLRVLGAPYKKLGAFIAK